MHALLPLPLICFVAVAFAGEPPPPSLEKPVDYVAWLNKECGGRIKENAAELYLKACEALVVDPEASAAAKRPARTWTDAQRRAIQQWVERNEEALRGFRAAAQVRHCFFELSSESGAMFEVQLPYLTSLRQLSIAATARARLRLAEGDTEGALEDVGAVLRATRHLERQPIMITYLVGVASSSLVYDALQEFPVLLDQDSDLTAILATLRKVDRTPASLRSALDGECVFFLDGLQRWSKDTDADGKIEMVRLPEGFAGETDRLDVNPPRELAALAKITAELLEISRKMERARYPEARALEEQGRHRLLKLGELAGVMPAMWRVDKVRRTRDARRHAARVILRMHAYRAEHGEWPKTLRGAMKGELPTLRRDPFSDGDLVYKLKGGQPLLYSVGADGEDDRGRRAEEDSLGERGDLIFWPLP